MTRRQIRDAMAQRLAGWLAQTDHEERCRLAGLDAGSTSVLVDQRLNTAVDELCAVLLGSVAGQYKTHSRGR